MTKRTARVARIGIAVLFAGSLALGTSACTFATLDPNTPGTGAFASAAGVQVMNVVLLGSGGTSAKLVVSILSADDDTLVSVSGNPITYDGTQGQPFAAVQVNRGIRADTLANLDGAGITLTSPDLAKSVSAQVTFTFSKAGDITVQAPVASKDNPTYNTSGAGTPGS